MTFNRVFDIAAAIVVLATVTVVITSPQTSGIIRAVGGTFSDSIRAATQQGR